MSGGGDWNTSKLVVIGKYTQTRQRWLKGKIVKYGHGRHYKKTFTVAKKGESKNRGRARNIIERK